MKIVGLVTEYNPFHNGHKYHIEEAKKLTGADYVVAVMSGSFVQRGTPAMVDKYNRTAMALQNGVDVVFELPVCYATGSAEFFAHGAVSLLDALGIVDSICFGSECGDITPLVKAAHFLSDAPSAFEDDLKEFLKEGLTYPAARLKALKPYLDDKSTEDARMLSQVLTQPNNILGIEYLKAIHKLSSSLQPVTIKRLSAHYHDSELSSASHNKADPEAFGQTGDIPMISSATAIRRAIDNPGNNLINDFNPLSHSVPSDVYEFLTVNFGKTYPITEEDFASLLRYKLLYEDKQALSEYMDITRELADRMKNISDLHKPISELTKELKTRNMTLTRVNRALVHLLLNIRTRDLKEFNSNGYSQYARVLGIKKESSQLLRRAKKVGSIPILTQVSRADTQLDALGMRMLSQDILATHLYNQAVFERYGYRIANEYKHGIIIL